MAAAVYMRTTPLEGRLGPGAVVLLLFTKDNPVPTHAPKPHTLSTSQGAL